MPISFSSAPIVYQVEPEIVSQETQVEWTFETLLPHLAKKYGQDEDLVRKIIKCESHFDPDAKNDNYNKEGEYWSSDWGYWQINDYWHLEDAKRHNYDIVHSWQDNLEWGFKLLKQDGAMRHWGASAYCWNK